MRDHCQAFAAVSVAGVNVIASINAATVHVHLGAVGEGIFDGIGIKILIDVRSAIGVDFVVTSAQRLCLDRPGVLHPAKVIDMMNVKVIETAAAGPEETMEVPNLPKQLTGIAGPLGRECGSDRPVHSVTA